MSAKKHALTLEFPDNRLLVALGGPHAKHLARLEQKLNVHIDMRGNLVAIDGKERERAGSAWSVRRRRGQHHGGGGDPQCPAQPRPSKQTPKVSG